MLDSYDRRILSVLQRRADIGGAELAAEIGLSQTAAWKRVKRLEADGIIEKRVALVNGAKLGMGVTVFATVRTSRHDEDWLADFASAVSAIREVVEVYRLSGESDYMLKIVCSSIEHYDRIYKKLIRSAPLLDVSSSFAMEQIKYTTEVPLPTV